MVACRLFILKIGLGIRKRERKRKRKRKRNELWFAECGFLAGFCAGFGGARCGSACLSEGEKQDGKRFDRFNFRQYYIIPTSRSRFQGPAVKPSSRNVCRERAKSFLPDYPFERQRLTPNP